MGGELGRNLVAPLKAALEPPHRLTGTYPPVAIEGDEDPERELPVLGVERQRHNLANVGVLVGEPSEPQRLTGALKLAACLLGQPAHPLEVGGTRSGQLAICLELLERPLPDRLEHPEAIVRAAEQAL